MKIKEQSIKSVQD